jgi:hypothetical protein
VFSEEEKKQMMLMAYKKQEELKVVFASFHYIATQITLHSTAMCMHVEVGDYKRRPLPQFRMG